MALPISIEKLLDGRTVEGHRVEFKKGWDPAPIYRTICAFANDIANEGGGYVVVGVEEKNGLPVRPVKGIDISEIEPIEKKMVGFNNLINPVYFPKTSVEDIDGKKVFVIWCPAGLYRPYEVPDDVLAKEKKYNYRVRYNSSSIVPKGEMRMELLELASNVPFDDRPNMEATIDDVSKTLVRDYLVKTGSKLARQVETEPFEKILQGMDLLAGPKEAIYPKNVALMMFNDHPEKFFPCTQVDIVVFPGGKREDPNNFMEVPPIVGPIDAIFRKTMMWLEGNVLKQSVKKVATKTDADKAWNYPEAALEEIVANCLYHRDYKQREPIEIQVEPREIRFISYGGPDRSVRLEDFSKGIVNPRRYRNRRIGDFFKELDITEGKSTGVPTIVDAMRDNGSPAVRFEFDEERTWFMVTVPVHPVFFGDDPVNDPINDPVNDPINDTVNDTINDTVNDTINDRINDRMIERFGPIVLKGRQLMIYEMIEENDRITAEEMKERCGVSMPTIKRDIAKMKKAGVLIRVGSRKTGCWMLARKLMKKSHSSI